MSIVPSTIPRRERERLLRREAMLQAARTVFAEKGYSGATLDEIAQRAEFGKGTLYNYFDGGKEGLFRAILDELFDDAEQMVESSFCDSTNFGEAFHRFVTDAMKRFEERRDLFIILLKEMQRMMLSDEPDRAEYIRGQHYRIIGALVPHIVRAQEQGELRNIDPVFIAHTIFGNISGVQLHRCTAPPECGNGANLTPEVVADNLSAILLDGLRIEEHQYSR